MYLKTEHKNLATNPSSSSLPLPTTATESLGRGITHSSLPSSAFLRCLRANRIPNILSLSEFLLRFLLYTTPNILSTLSSTFTAFLLLFFGFSISQSRAAPAAAAAAPATFGAATTLLTSPPWDQEEVCLKAREVLLFGELFIILNHSSPPPPPPLPLLTLEESLDSGQRRRPDRRTLPPSFTTFTTLNTLVVRRIPTDGIAVRFPIESARVVARLQIRFSRLAEFPSELTQ